MKAIGLLEYLPIENENSLIDIEIPRPVPHEKDLLIKINAISVNPVDVKVRSPKPQKEANPKILGWDASGVVVEVGADCTLFKPGDEVFYAGSITKPGTYSEYHVVDERLVGKKPKSLTNAESAAIPLTAITAWEGLFERLGIEPENKDKNKSKSILIIGGAGGVGSIAIQLAKWAGLHVIATASRNETREWVKNLGADYIINHHKPFKEQLLELQINDVDYIFCLNNTDQHWHGMGESIKPQGKICSIVENEHPLELNILKSKSATFVWEFMFTKAMYQTDDMILQHNLLNKVSELLDQGMIKTTLNQTLTPINAENLRKAHTLIESGRTIGKIVLERF
ncbi:MULTISPECIES: zinc-binding alcohol dehydrogenase family protein [Bacillus cereus group]|uniref:Zinc-type alcohol dehydrogenase-like protein n=1 Tax=Bacillus cereus TaxID=1396 RepID=A0AA44Q8H7_BACCE|nr:MULTISPECIES: zinc-binding alcohol dehydrogenase family protein [Bacillus cereus group]PFN06016.1 zinc-binding alcohol dehydrogenase family protein [Bacillus cereus]PFO82063.1 zinc-binding alcohol dehydrogenase family protein [Bacillus cereus]PFR26860.1 zinc-binding alcohol dehydrogenase family protein [Bacillus cereus]PFR98655.1 zinc-binding alcohol dehydrogenase family protein [Bacillus cereus]PGZ12342.1 zinc-binding alcohol dehydrogenase family protein [Bacillus cereus]